MKRMSMQCWILISEATVVHILEIIITETEGYCRKIHCNRQTGQIRLPLDYTKKRWWQTLLDVFQQLIITVCQMDTSPHQIHDNLGHNLSCTFVKRPFNRKEDLALSVIAIYQAHKLFNATIRADGEAVRITDNSFTRLSISSRKVERIKV